MRSFPSGRVDPHFRLLVRNCRQLHSVHNTWPFGYSLSFVFFFFFSSRRRHTRCLSDWSSDVCSSDLVRSWNFARAESIALAAVCPKPQIEASRITWPISARKASSSCQVLSVCPVRKRSEERRVGKECRCRRSPESETKKKSKKRGKAI